MGVLENKTRARYFYKYLSKVYDQVNAFIFTTSMRDAALDMLDLSTTDHVLDVGCGTGFGTAGLLRYTEHVYGLDQSPHQLAKARKRLSHEDSVRYFFGDAERLPFEDDSFDAAWSSGSIEYWPNPVEGLREMRRVVKPGGTVVVVGPNEPNSEFWARVADAIMLFYDEEEAQRMFREAGYDDISHTAVGPVYKPDIALVSVGTVPESE
jgi:demethylmenaquinone methyltransferase/2-methoxy-6-polyprenyl-1,4-benzoquinol methylase